MKSASRSRLKRRVRNAHRRRYWQTLNVDPEDYECPGCGRGADAVDQHWEVHHRNGDWLDGRLLNLVAVCHACHIALHRREIQQRQLREWKTRVEDLGNGVDKPETDVSTEIAGWSA